jgi:hypothetical protein
MIRDGHDRYLLPQVVPFLIGVFLDTRNPAMSRASGGGPPPHFNRTGDNLLETPSAAVAPLRPGVAYPEVTPANVELHHVARLQPGGRSDPPA